MLDALKTSTESREYVELARKYLRGVIGDLVRRKKMRKEQERRPENSVVPTPDQPRSRPSAPQSFPRNLYANDGYPVGHK